MCVVLSCRLIDARGELAVLALLRPEGAAGTLDLSACGFDTLPSIVWELPGRLSALQELHLATNRLHTLPEVRKNLPVPPGGRGRATWPSEDESMIGNQGGV